MLALICDDHSVVEKKKLEAAQHRFQRRLLGITWKDKVKNEEIRK